MESEEEMNAIMTIYWFMYPQHYKQLLAAGMGVKWKPGRMLIFADNSAKQNQTKAGYVDIDEGEKL